MLCSKLPYRFIGESRGALYSSIYTPEYASNIHVDERNGCSKRKAGNCCRRIRAYSGELLQFLGCTWQITAKILYYGLRQLVQVARPTVVPESRPKHNDFCLGRTGKRVQTWESLEEGVILRDDPIHLGLLQHDFGDQYAV